MSGPLYPYRGVLPRVDASVFVAPSLHGESFGVILLESMAASTPIVASDLDGYRKVARPDIDALLVPPGDADALAVAINRVLAEPALAARLGAAGDARATLVVDADSETSAVAGYFNQRPEPGFSDAIAGVRLWREVARPVGANDGLSLDMVPGGSIRRDETDVATLQLARGEFERFRDEYDFCVAVASSELAVQRISAIMDGPTFVLCGEIGQTTIEDFARQAYRLRESGAHLHGVVLWDAASPQLPTRNALMGRVVGGTSAGRSANS